MSRTSTMRTIAWIAGSVFILAGGVALLFRAEIAEELGNLTWAQEVRPEKLYFIVVWTARCVALIGFFLIWSQYFKGLLSTAGVTHSTLFAHSTSRRTTLLVISYVLLVGAYTSQYGFYNLPAFVLVLLAMGILVSVQFGGEADGSTAYGPTSGPHTDESTICILLGPLVLLASFAFLIYSGGVYQTRLVFVYLIHMTNILSFCLVLPYMKGDWNKKDPLMPKGLLQVWDRAHFVALLACALGVRIFMILSSPDPQIDVFFVMQQSAHGILEGKNPYSMTFGPSWYGKSTISYLPAMIYLAVPARVLLGDVRYTYAVSDVLAAVILYAMVKRLKATDKGRYIGRCLALLYLFNPMALFILEQSWTDTAVIALVYALWFVWFCMRRSIMASILLGIITITKQYFVLIVPYLLRHKRLTPAQLGTAILTGAVLALPLALWNLHDFIEDAVLYLFRLEPKPESLNLFSFVYHLTGSRLPGAIALLLVPVGVLLYVRQRTSVSSLTGSCCLVLWCFFFLIKQASLNYLYGISSFMLLWLACAIVEDTRPFPVH